MLETEVLILGGGLVGGVCASLLKRYNIPFIVVDTDTPKKMIESVSDGRTTAVSLGSKHIFEKAGLWSHELEHIAQPIHSIRVLDLGSVWSLDFDHVDLSSEPMGYIIENMYLRKAILDNLEDNAGVFYETSVEKVDKKDSFVEAVLSNGEVVRARLLISAEGKRSPSRSLIAPQIKSRDYGQNALVVHLSHQKIHNNQAWEIFTPDGPFAILPLKDDDNKKSGVVFCRSSAFIWNKLSDLEIENEIYKIFPYYGKIKIVSKRWQFPLSNFELNKIVGFRQVLVGDSAHGMHPIAGQGVNLGWRDADILTSQINQAYTLGLDVGADHLLQSYSRKRKLDVKILLKTTDIMNQLFASDLKTLRFIRNVGFSLVNQLKPLKRFFMKKAMGL